MDNPIAQIITNRHLITGIISLVTAQILKVFFHLWQNKTLKQSLLFSTGGMPSSHSSLAVSVMISIGIFEGFDSAMFALSAVLAMVVMHDAAGIRRAAGKQAEAINFLSRKLEKQGIHLDKNLKELLGHHPIEVLCGGLLGLLIALVGSLIFPY